MPATIQAAPLAEATPPGVQRTPDSALEVIGQALRGLRFGTVTAIVQDGVVVQVERTEKHRVRRP